MVTSLANQLDAVAVSSDGDFFLHDAKRGVIDVQSFCTSVMKNHTYCKIYHRQNLAKNFKIRDDLTPLLALVLGNDYTVDNYRNRLRLRIGIESSDNFKEVSTKLADYLVNLKAQRRSRRDFGLSLWRRRSDVGTVTKRTWKISGQ